MERKRVDAVSYTLSQIPVAQVDSKSPDFVKKLIEEAREESQITSSKVMYIVSEVLPLGVLSEDRYYLITDNLNELKPFIDSFTKPYPIPVIYEHLDNLMPGDKGAPYAGRVTKVRVMNGYNGKPAIFAVQAITEEKAIQRITDMTDITQSVGLMVREAVCNACGHPTYTREHIQDCDIGAGEWYEEIAENGTRTYKRNYFTVVPKRALEVSFTAIPAFPSARVVAFEDPFDGSLRKVNFSLTRTKPDGMPTVYFQYVGKKYRNGMSFEKHDIIEAKNNEGEDLAMEELELAAEKIVEALEKQISSILERKLAEFITKFEAENTTQENGQPSQGQSEENQQSENNEQQSENETALSDMIKLLERNLVARVENIEKAISDLSERVKALEDKAKFSSQVEKTEEVTNESKESSEDTTSNHFGNRQVANWMGISRRSGRLF